MTSQCTVPSFVMTSQCTGPRFVMTSQCTVFSFVKTSQCIVPSFIMTSQCTVPSFVMTSQCTVPSFVMTFQCTVPSFVMTSQCTVPSFVTTSQYIGRSVIKSKGFGITLKPSPSACTHFHSCCTNSYFLPPFIPLRTQIYNQSSFHLRNTGSMNILFMGLRIGVRLIRIIKYIMGHPHISGGNIFIFPPNISEMHRCDSVNGYKISKHTLVCKVYGTKCNCRM
jgi:hypothetical protein